MNKMKTYKTIDAYIASYPKDVQVILEKMRSTIQKLAPKAEEAISYGIPTFKLNGNLVHFAAYEKHIGFYPGAAGIFAFQKEISKYKWSKGTVQFPVGEPIPWDLISKIVKFRVKENTQKEK